MMDFPVMKPAAYAEVMLDAEKLCTTARDFVAPFNKKIKPAKIKRYFMNEPFAMDDEA